MFDTRIRRQKSEALEPVQDPGLDEGGDKRHREAMPDHIPLKKT